MDIHEILRERILVLDGAMGTVLQSQNSPLMILVARSTKAVMNT